MDNFGGVNKIYITNYDSNDYFFFDTDGTISFLTGEYFTFTQEDGQASYSETITTNSLTGTNLFETNLTMVISTLSVENKNVISELNKGKFRIIILDQNGNFFLMGIDNPVRCTNLQVGIGKIAGDLNGATITLTAKSKMSSPMVSLEAVLGVIFPTDTPAEFQEILSFSMTPAISGATIGPDDVYNYTLNGLHNLVSFYGLGFINPYPFPNQVLAATQAQLNATPRVYRTYNQVHGSTNQPVLSIGFRVDNIGSGINYTYIWNNGEGSITPTLITDVKGNLAKYAPVFQMDKTHNSILNTFVPSISCETIASNYTEVLIKIRIYHSDLPPEADFFLNFDINVSKNPSGDPVTLIPVEDESNAYYLIMSPGMYNLDCNAIYKDNHTDVTLFSSCVSMIIGTGNI